MKFIQQANSSIQQLSVKSIEGLLVGNPSAKQAIINLTPQAKAAIYHASIHAYTLGFSVAMFLTAIFTAACFWCAFQIRLTHK